MSHFIALKSDYNLKIFFFSSQNEQQPPLMVSKSVMSFKPYVNMII